MGNKNITDSESLALQISQLKAERTSHEEALALSFNELTQVFFNPVRTIISQSHEKKNRKREFINISKIIVNLGSDYLIEQTFGKRQKLSNFLTAVAVELISVPLINSMVTKIFAGIDQNIFGDSEEV